MDLKNVPKDLLTFSSTSVLLPFWYVSIYIFLPEIYYASDLILNVSICICLSITSSVVFSLACKLDMNNENVNVLHESVIIPSIIIQITVLSILIFIGYIFKLKTETVLEFYSFVLIYFLIGIVYLLYTIMPSIKKGKTKK